MGRWFGYALAFGAGLVAGRLFGRRAPERYEVSYPATPEPVAAPAPEAAPAPVAVAETPAEAAPEVVQAPSEEAGAVVAEPPAEN